MLVFHLLFCSSAVELDLDAVELVSDFLLYARMQSHLDAIQYSLPRVLCVCGVFLADPSFHLRHLLHGLGEILFHLDAVEVASDLTVLHGLGEILSHLDGVEVARDLIVALASDCFLYTWIQSHLGAIQ